MYDDASFYYETNANALPTRRQPSSGKHRRTSSLLDKQPTNSDSPEIQHTSRFETVLEDQPAGPPKATLKRRAQSYTDFHHAARLVLERSKPPRNDKRKSRSIDLDGAARFAQDKRPEKESDIANEYEFAQWYEQLEMELLDSVDDEYTIYLKQLSLSKSHLQKLLSQTDTALDILGSLTKSFKDVEIQTTRFQKQCQGLLDEQKRVEHLADDLDQNLKYYNYLEPVTRRLNAPGAGSFVRSEEFSDMLARLDDCLDYMTAHPNHRESATYLSRYRLLMTRGLTLIRVNFVGGLREIASDVSRRIADGQLKETTMAALLYAKFRVGAAEMKAVAQEIRKRSRPPEGAEAGTEAEYQSLMNELYSSYSATRGKLVIPLARKKIADISVAPSTSKDLVAFARTSIGYIRGVCSDEYELWREWFEGEDGLYDFLESVCEPLYDHLRPRIIYETKILKLCELCTLLQTRYVHDPDEEAEPIEAYQLDFASLIRSALEDAQTRLVFRTQAILRDEIERYKPKSEELDYPARNRQVSLSGTKSQRSIALSGRKTSAAEPTTPLPKPPEVVEGGESPNGHLGFDTEAALEGWYPTLKKAIWLLSRIYRLVNSTVFDDLAHTIVHATTVSLLSASALMNTTHPKTTPSDARLFLIKHLLLLKQQIVAFDIEYVHQPSPSLDFSSLTTTFYELRTRGSIFDPRNLWRLMTNPTNLFPKVVENMLDAKVELDGRLRTVINDFTTAQAGTITQPIDTSALAKPKFDPLSAVTQVKALAEKEVPPLRKRLESYLTDLRTRETLVAAIRDQVLLNYESFYDLWTEKQAKDGKEGGGKTRSKKGKGREGEVWDVDMFEEWAGGVFGVREFGLLGNHDNDDRDDDDNRNHGNDDDDDDDGGDSSAVSRDGSV